MANVSPHPSTNQTSISGSSSSPGWCRSVATCCETAAVQFTAVVAAWITRDVSASIISTVTAMPAASVIVATDGAR
jgi:hypothetical protein